MPLLAEAKISNGDKLVAQYIIPASNGGNDQYGPTPDSDSVLVGDCTKVSTDQSLSAPTLKLSQPANGKMSYSGTVSGSPPANTSVRICVNHVPSTDAGTPGVTNGTFNGGSSSIAVKAGDTVAAQLVTSDKPPKYSLLSAEKPITSLGLGVGSQSSDGFVSTIVAGVEQTGYSSLGSNTDGFVSAFFRTGYLPFSRKSPSGLAAWGRVRILGAPQPGVLGISSILTDPTGQITTQSFSTIGTAFDYVIGPELKLNEWKTGTTKSRLSLIAGVGATTPLSTNQVTVSYAVPPPLSAQCQQLIQLYGAGNKFGNNPYLFPNPNPANSCVYNPQTGQPYSYISFVNENRSNFLFKWGIGGRLTHVYRAQDKNPSYAGILDVTVGQDSTITGGKVSGWGFKLDSVYPIPFTGSLLYVFGTASMRFQHNYDYPLLPLTAATGVPAPPSQQVAILSQQQPNRDFYRLGFGLNLATLFCKFKPDGCPQQGSGESGGTPTTGGQTPTKNSPAATQTTSSTSPATGNKP